MAIDIDPDRLFPVEPAVRSRARALYDSVADAPIVSPHGHVDPAILLDNRPFANAAELFITNDHYVTRLLHAAGIGLQDLGVAVREGDVAAADPREVWRHFCDHWSDFSGTASGGWLRTTFSEILRVDAEPSAAVADQLFEAIADRLWRPEYRPRALFERFRIEVLATTDDPLDDLAVHREIAGTAALSGRVIPTFRPDAYLDPTVPGWRERVERLTAGVAGDGYRAYLDALASRREHFLRHGAVSADHGTLSAEVTHLTEREAAALYDDARAGRIDAREAARFAAHMLLESARMSVEDGLVMTLHAGALRNHHTDTFRRFGPDTGHDIPVPVDFVRGLRPLLERYGTAPGFHLVLFGMDEATASRELAPLAGFYPSVYLGAPWWFLDAPDAMMRFRAAVTETAGFSRGSGFIDDTRSFLSIPVRHDTARRVDASFLARLVMEGRVTMTEAERVIRDSVGDQPRRVFKL
ncbi:glucuronate isomerase [Microbacterium immunditiarum]|uniref:Uronate isomerase n=1 Tax=Microbacterium immunditiarum TaxID=337480 RepID=A0A7Y9KLC4_9MICO|nr:glucuronate isomerase [Microbacterium immunditiarum]